MNEWYVVVYAMVSQRQEEFLKRTGSTVIEMLREATKAAEEWNASLCANNDARMREEELLVEIDARKKKETLLLEERDKLSNEIAAQKVRETLVLESRGDLIHQIAACEERVTSLMDDRRQLLEKIAAQNERESLLLQDREKLLHEIDVRKRTKSLLIQERKELLLKTSALTKRERLLYGYKEVALSRTDSQRKTKAVLLQVRKGLLNKIGAHKKAEKVLLQDRTEIIKCLSKRIHVQKKRESQLLQEQKKSEVKLRKALNRLRHLRGTVSDRTITSLWDVTQKVLTLITDLEESQLVGDKTTTPRVKSPLQMPSTLQSSWNQATRMIERAEAAVVEAARNWKRDRECIELMKIYSREGLIDKILGREERASEAQAALRDILDESQSMERRRQSNYKTLAAVELEYSEKTKVRRKHKKPQRIETRPSPSRQDAEVRGKRQKTQAFGTSPPPSTRMNLPRERKQPERYRTSP